LNETNQRAEGKREGFLRLVAPWGEGEVRFVHKELVSSCLDIDRRFQSLGAEHHVHKSMH
jgi:hypothetical protein